MSESERTVAVIPARWASTRFPGKPLAVLCGKPMIVHVMERVHSAASVDHVVVATDDQRIADAVAGAGGLAVMTGDCTSGTDRVAEAARVMGDVDLVVNVQGDEPLLSGRNIDTLVEGLKQRTEIGMATLCRPLDGSRLTDPNAVKVVRSLKQLALYFSRAPIPYQRHSEQGGVPALLHLGIYAFRREALAQFVAWPTSRLELSEGLEQLRALENGMEILVLDAPDEAMGVDTPEDLELAAAQIRESRYAATQCSE